MVAAAGRSIDSPVPAWPSPAVQQHYAFVPGWAVLSVSSGVAAVRQWCAGRYVQYWHPTTAGTHDRLRKPDDRFAATAPDDSVFADKGVLGSLADPADMHARATQERDLDDFEIGRSEYSDMATDLTERVHAIADAREKPESEIRDHALERGVEDLWIEGVLLRYVNGEIDRETAIELVGRDRVKRAERELQAVSDDVQWGLDA